MKMLIFTLVLLFVISNVSALKINEVEMNPPGDDKGNEWIELYNEGNEDIDIFDWKVWDGLKTPTKRYTIPNETIIKTGEYYIITFTNQVLNNDKNGDFVTLKNSNNELVDETSVIVDETDNTKTNQFCSSTWKFLEQTKGIANNCEEEVKVEDIAETNNEENSSQEVSNTITISSPVSTQPSREYFPENFSMPKITINSQSIKTTENEQKNSKINFAVYGLAGFCLLLATLFAIKKFRKNKNEFRE